MRYPDALEVPYFTGGSVASILYGEVRTTLDADMVARLGIDHMKRFVQLLDDDFYADEHMIQDAVERQASFNAIHLASMFKIDVFVSKERAFEQAQFERRKSTHIAKTSIYVASPEESSLPNWNGIEPGTR